MVSQAKLIKQGIYLTDSLFDEIIRRLAKGIQTSDTLEDFLNKTKEYTMNNPLVVTGYKDKLLEIILQETNNHKFSRPAQKELTRLTIENRVGDLIVDVGEDIKYNVRDIVKNGYNNKLSQDEIAENINKKITTIKNKRARAIARTEIARTATASDYVINQERGANAFTVDCRNTACDYCKQKVLKNPEREATGKGMTGDVEFGIDDVENLPPFHPNCRCVAMFFKKEGVGDQNDLEFKEYDSPNSEGILNNIVAPLQNEGDYFESNERFGLISEKRFKRDIKGFVDSGDENIITNLVSRFRRDAPNVHVEFGATFLHNSLIGFSSFSNFTRIPSWIRKIGAADELLVVIHNHGYDLSNFPSYDDLESYATYGVKYGITTTNFGTIIVKNNEQQLNKQNAKDIRMGIIEIKKGMIVDYEKKFNKKYDEDNLEHNKEISKMVDDNKEKYLEQYRKALGNYNIDITFINEQT